MWYKVEDKLPEMKQQGYLDRFESEVVLVKVKQGNPCVAYCYKNEGDGKVHWITDCSESWDITKDVTEWTEIPE